MASADWSNPKGPDFRFAKTIVPEPGALYPDYPAVFSIYGTSARDEGERFADLVAYLKEQGIVEDYSQVALLLHSVREEHSGPLPRRAGSQGHPGVLPASPRLLRERRGPPDGRLRSRSSSATTARAAARRGAGRSPSWPPTSTTA